ncbi:MAG TPA: alpha/beta fold hydrolase [Blastocatellia bacterium]|nr:alpha/beta fold hydrolase [Blastocatellia bacterium]
MTTKSPWLATCRPNSKAAIRLFCFPYAGGSDSIFRSWQGSFPDAIEVCPVQLPGRGARIMEPPFTEIGPLLQDATVALAPYLDKPFAIFGHSMGALIGFEMARLLRRDYALQPIHLFVSGRCSPQTTIERNAKEPSDAEFINLLSRYNSALREVIEDPELMELMLPVIRADYTMCRSYQYSPAPPFDCSITALGGLLDPTVGRKCIEGWREHTRDTFIMRMLPGDHFFVNSERALVLAAIARELYCHARDLA